MWGRMGIEGAISRSLITKVTSSPASRRGLPTRPVLAGLGASGLYPVVIQGVPRPRYPYPRWIREYLDCFLTVSTAVHSTGIPSNGRVELPILSHYTGRMDRLGWYHRWRCIPVNLLKTALYPRRERRGISACTAENNDNVVGAAGHYSLSPTNSSASRSPARYFRPFSVIS